VIEVPPEVVPELLLDEPTLGMQILFKSNIIKIYREWRDIEQEPFW
jgi:ABC-type uncharacterized transport system ATPase subunit